MPALRATEISTMRRGIQPSDVSCCGSGRLGRGKLPHSILDAIAGLENPADRTEAEREKQKRHGEADAEMHVGGFKEAPAETADQIDDRIEQRDRLPAVRQHMDRIEGAAEKRQGLNDQQRYDLQLLETIGPDAEDETEQAEAHRGQYEERDHPERMCDMQWHEQPGGRECDQPKDDRLGRRRADE